MLACAGDGWVCGDVLRGVVLRRSEVLRLHRDGIWVWEFAATTWCFSMELWLSTSAESKTMVKVL